MDVLVASTMNGPLCKEIQLLNKASLEICTADADSKLVRIAQCTKQIMRHETRSSHFDIKTYFITTLRIPMLPMNTFPYHATTKKA